MNKFVDINGAVHLYDLSKQALDSAVASLQNDLSALQTQINTFTNTNKKCYNMAVDNSLITVDNKTVSIMPVPILSPNDTTEQVCYYSDNLTVGNVSSAGVLSISNAGYFNVITKCGDQSITTPIKAQYYLDMSDIYLGNWMQVSDTSIANKSIVYSQTGHPWQRGIYINDSFVIKQGSTVTVTTSTGCVINNIKLLGTSNYQLSANSSNYYQAEFDYLNYQSIGNLSANSSTDITVERDSYLTFMCYVQNHDNTTDHTTQELNQLQTGILVIITPPPQHT